MPAPQPMRDGGGADRPTPAETPGRRAPAPPAGAGRVLAPKAEHPAIRAVVAAAVPEAIPEAPPANRARAGADREATPAAARRGTPGPGSPRARRVRSRTSELPQNRCRHPVPGRSRWPAKAATSATAVVPCAAKSAAASARREWRRRRAPAPADAEALSRRHRRARGSVRAMARRPSRLPADPRRETNRRPGPRGPGAARPAASVGRPSGRVIELPCLRFRRTLPTARRPGARGGDAWRYHTSTFGATCSWRGVAITVAFRRSRG